LVFGATGPDPVGIVIAQDNTFPRRGEKMAQFFREDTAEMFLVLYDFGIETDDRVFSRITKVDGLNGWFEIPEFQDDIMLFGEGQ